MKTKLHIVIFFLCIVTFLLLACGQGQSLEPTLVPAPTETAAPSATAVPDTTPTPSAGSVISLNCEDWALINLAGFQAQNNTWGKGDLTDWSQCIGLETDSEGILLARWTWDWPKAGGSVKSYPEVVFGQKPGGPSTSPDLPKKLSDIDKATIEYDVASTYTGSGNIAFDIWLTDTDNPDTWGVPPITHEIMIWLDSYGGLGPGGKYVESVTLDGVEYNVFVGYNFGGGWTYIAFNSKESQLGTGMINLSSFIEYIIASELAPADVYMASIEFGNEVVSGTGETVLNKYRISINPE